VIGFFAEGKDFMTELPLKFLVVHVREDRPMTDDEPRMVEGHGFTPEEFAELLEKSDHFVIGGKRFDIVKRMPQQMGFMMKYVK
jgi:hypothetical protein